MKLIFSWGLMQLVYFFLMYLCFLKNYSTKDNIPLFVESLTCTYFSLSVSEWCQILPPITLQGNADSLGIPFTTSWCVTDHLPMLTTALKNSWLPFIREWKARRSSICFSFCNRQGSSVKVECPLHQQPHIWTKTRYYTSHPLESGLRRGFLGKTKTASQWLFNCIPSTTKGEYFL